MIASNFRRYPEAMALQRPLPFPHRLTWHTPRPGPRLLRTLRAARSHAFELAGRIHYPTKRTIPQWWRDAKRRARRLADKIKDACMVLVAEIRLAITTADTELIGFNYEQDLATQQATQAHQRRTELRRLKAQKFRPAQRVKSFLGKYGTIQSIEHNGRLRILWNDGTMNTKDPRNVEDAPIDPRN